MRDGEHGAWKAILSFQQLKPQELQAASVSELTGASRQYCRLAERRQMGRRPPDTCAQGGDPEHRQHVESGTEARADIRAPAPHPPHT